MARRMEARGAKEFNWVMRRCLESGFCESVFDVYKGMRMLCVGLDGYTLPLMNQAVMRVGWVGEGMMIHCVGIEMGFGSDVYFGNTLIEVYAGFGATRLAYNVFDEMPERDLVSWTSMIGGFVRVGDGLGAFGLWNEMRAMGLEPNVVTMIVVLQACCCDCSVGEHGKLVHGYMIKKGFVNDQLVKNSLLKMYVDVYEVEDVEALYAENERSDVVALNILLCCYNSQGDTEGVLERFSEMQGEISPSKETLTLVASSLSKYSSTRQGQQLHCFAVKSGICDHVLPTSLSTMYAKCGDLGASVQLFEEIPHKSSIAWSSLMSAYVDHGHHEKAVELFNQIQLSTRFKAGVDILTTLIDTYADLGALRMGKVVHGYCIRNLASTNTESNSILETSIINMYFKCGHMSSARHCFDVMIKKDIIAWTSMIEGFGTHGLGLEAISLFDQMLEEGIKPNGITFLSLLSACSHSGLTIEGLHFLYFMRPRFGIDPDVLHYTCMVDLLGRSGQLTQALALCFKMLACPDSRTWGSLLAASRTSDHRKIGEYAAKRLLELEPENVGYHVVLSNIQASTEHWADVEALRGVVASDMNVKKTPGWSYIEVDREIEGFVAGDRTHPQTDEVYQVLRFLTMQMHHAGLS
ncbi:hypothetical protein Drorol1_Dr00012827 [Drosera rotundifolia]